MSRRSYPLLALVTDAGLRREYTLDLPSSIPAEDRDAVRHDLLQALAGLIEIQRSQTQQVQGTCQQGATTFPTETMEVSIGGCRVQGVSRSIYALAGGCGTELERMLDEYPPVRANQQQPFATIEDAELEAALRVLRDYWNRTTLNVEGSVTFPATYNMAAALESS